MRDRALHRTKRKLIGQVVNEKAMRAFEPTMLEQIDIFLKLLLQASDTSSSVDMTKMLGYLGIDIVGHLGFGYDLKSQTQDTYRFLTKALTLGNHRVNVCIQFPPLIHLKPGIISNMIPNSQRAKFLAMIDTMIASRLSKPMDAKRDLIGFIADTMGDDMKDLRDQDLWPEAVFFFPAGTCCHSMKTVSSATCVDTIVSWINRW